jgi:hypothetical protein
VVVAQEERQRAEHSCDREHRDETGEVFIRVDLSAAEQARRLDEEDDEQDGEGEGKL